MIIKNPNRPDFCGQYLYAIKTVQGQPTAVWTPDRTRAKQFKTTQAAAKFIAKWNGTGVGLQAADLITE